MIRRLLVRNLYLMALGRLYPLVLLLTIITMRNC